MDGGAEALTRFLAIHATAFHALRDSLSPGDAPVCGAVLDDLIQRLDRDLADRAIKAVRLPVDGPLVPAAVDYLVLGSRLGSEVLRRTLVSGDALPLPSYFDAPPAGPLWRRLCDDLAAIDPNGQTAAKIILDTRTGFGLFAKAATATQEGH